jgi:hypothetical protein
MDKKQQKSSKSLEEVLFAEDSKDPNHKKERQEILTLYNLLTQSSQKIRLQAMQRLREWTIDVKKAPIQHIFNFGLLGPIVEAAICDKNTVLQFEALWVLGNLSCSLSKHTTRVAQFPGLVSELFRMLRSSSTPPESIDCILLIFGNMAGDSVHRRNQLWNLNLFHDLLRLLDHLLRSLKDPKSFYYFENVIWVLYNLLRYRSVLIWNKIRHSFPFLLRVLKLQGKVSDDVLADACHCLFALVQAAEESDEDASRTPESVKCRYELVSSGFLQYIVPLFNSSSQELTRPVFDICDVVASAPHTIAQHLVREGFFTKFVEVLVKVLDKKQQTITPEDDRLLRQLLFIFSNLVVGGHWYIQAIFDEIPDYIPIIVSFMFHKSVEMQLNAAHIISSFCLDSTTQQIVWLLSYTRLMSALCYALVSKSSKVIILSLESIHSLLTLASRGDLQQYFESPVDLRSVFEEYGILCHLDNCQFHSDDNVYEKAVEILVDFYSASSDCEIIPRTVETTE